MANVYCRHLSVMLERFAPKEFNMKRLALLGAAILIGLLPNIASARSRVGISFGLNLGGFGIGIHDGFPRIPQGCLFPR